MMKKIFLTTALLSSVTWNMATAQSYNPNYPSNMSYNYSNYGSQPTPKAKSDDLKHFSIGFDYIFGSAGIADKPISLDNPLLGGDPFETNTSRFDDRVDSLNGNIGFRPFRYLGFEAFYQKSLENTDVQYRESYAQDIRFAQTEYTLKYEAYGIDVLGYIPVTTWLELLGTFGVSKYEFDAELNFNAYRQATGNDNLYKSTNYKINESKTALRYGVGAQVWLSKRLAFRAMYRYADIGGEFFEDIQEISLGVRYNF